MPSDPLRPLTDRQLRRRTRRDIQSVLGPLAKQISSRASAGAQNIEGVYSRLASNLAGYQGQQADIYGRARSTLEGYQAQGAQDLQQSGGAINSELQRNMALSGAQGSIAPDLGRIASGQGTRGGAELGELALRQAAAENYAAQVPGFARLAGAQGIQQVQAQRQKDIAEMTARAQQSMLSSLQSGRRQEYEKAVAARGFGLDYAKEAADARQKAAERAERRRHNQATETRQEREARERRRHNETLEQRQERERRDRNRKARKDREQREAENRRAARKKKKGKKDEKSDSKSGY